MRSDMKTKLNNVKTKSATPNKLQQMIAECVSSAKTQISKQRALKPEKDRTQAKEAYRLAKEMGVEYVKPVRTRQRVRFADC